MYAETLAILSSKLENMTMKGLRMPYPDVNNCTTSNLPPDPDRMNDLRALRADDVLVASEGPNGDGVSLQTLSDMLCRMGHWCDRNSVQMADALRLAAASYSEQTEAIGRQFSA